jgi:hypothetical protein
LQDAETSEPLPDIALLDAKITEADEALKKAETSSEKRRAKERRDDLLTLKRVEQIYVCSTTPRLLSTFVDYPLELSSSCDVQLYSCPSQTSTGYRFCQLKYATSAIVHVFGLPAWCGIS